MIRLLRACLFAIPAVLESSAMAWTKPPPVILRQIVIRAPKTELVGAVMTNPDDEALAKLLWGWVAEGKASVLSEIAARPTSDRASFRSGADVHLTTENDQDFENAQLRPVGWRDVFVGTSCECQIQAPREAYEGRLHERALYDVNIAASFSPRNEENVRWPVWWPPNPATKPNWYEQKEFYLERVFTTTTVPLGGHRVLGVVRRADQLEPDPMRIETLDIVLVHLSPAAEAQGMLAKSPPKAPSAQETKAAAPDPFAVTEPAGLPAQARCTLLAFGVADREAVTLLSRTGPHRDKELLDLLLQESSAHRANLRDFAIVSSCSGHRATVESARWHSFPTEMPTIPSAWEEYPSGTRMEIDPLFPRGVSFSFEHHPVPPRRAEWRCALDTPDLFMWQPQFIVRRINSSMEIGADGVALLGAMRTPDCGLGVPGLKPGETLIVMLRMDIDHPAPEELQAAGAGASRLEVEAVVFDVPASEALPWPAPPDEPGDDGALFAALLARVDGRQLKIAAHAALGTLLGGSNRASAVELAQSVTVTENNDSPIRYRPTAMESHEVGTILETVADAGSHALADAKNLHLKYILKHDTAMPQQPDYRDMIASLDEKKNPGRHPPPAVFFQETWEGTASVSVDRPKFIGARVPAGANMKDRLHVAFLRVRVLK